MNFDELDSIFKNGTYDDLENFCYNNDLVIKDNKIYHKNPKFVKQVIEHWDKRQHVKKILLNS